MAKSSELWCVGYSAEDFFNEFGDEYTPFVTADNKLLVFSTSQKAQAWADEKNTAHEKAYREWEERKQNWWDEYQVTQKDLYARRRTVLEQAGLWPDSAEDDPLTGGLQQSIVFPEKRPHSPTYFPLPYRNYYLDDCNLTVDDVVDVEGNTVIVDCACVACLTAEAAKETSMEGKISVFADKVSCPNCGGMSCPHAKTHVEPCCLDGFNFEPDDNSANQS